MRRGRGFSLFELVVALGLIAVLLAVFLERAVYYQEVAEKAAMEQVALDLRSSVNLRVAELVLENRFGELAALASQNPVELLVRQPQNYRGVLPSAAGGGPPAAGWYFDKDRKEVLYYVDLGRYFEPDETGLKRVSWRIQLLSGAGGTGPQWARLELTRPYRWF